MTLDLARAKRRLKIMFAIDGAAFLVAAAAGVGAFAYHIDWLTAVFVAALLAGFAAQFWFIAGFRRTDRGA